MANFIKQIYQNEYSLFKIVIKLNCKGNFLIWISLTILYKACEIFYCIGWFDVEKNVQNFSGLNELEVKNNSLFCLKLLEITWIIFRKAKTIIIVLLKRIYMVIRSYKVIN